MNVLFSGSPQERSPEGGSQGNRLNAWLPLAYLPWQRCANENCFFDYKAMLLNGCPKQPVETCVDIVIQSKIKEIKKAESLVFSFLFCDTYVL